MSRKRMLLTTLILVLCCAAFCVTAFAASCALRVTVRDEEQSIPDFTVAVCQVATLQDGVFTLTDDFSSLSISVEELVGQMTPEQATKIHAFAMENQVEAREQQTGETGTADFLQLPEGLYLVYAKKGQTVKFSPYLVKLPSRIGSEIVYDIYSSPKSVAGNLRDILVIVKWVDLENTAGLRPESVQITLYQDGAPVQRATQMATPVRQVSVNAACDWQHLFEDLPADRVYSVEQSVALQYTTTIEETESGFVITNTYTPPDNPDDPELPVDPDDHPHHPIIPDIPQKPDTPELPPVPQEPETPPVSDESNIPPAGFQMGPIYAMLAIGSAMVVIGLTDLYLRREEVYEEEWEEEQEISS